MDGVLVGSSSGSLVGKDTDINFTTGEISQSAWNGSGDGVEHTTIKSRFQEAGVTPPGGFSGNTFTPNTTHTLSVFYLERGNYGSVMKLGVSLIPRYPLYYDMNGGTGGPKQKD